MTESPAGAVRPLVAFAVWLAAVAGAVLLSSSVAHHVHRERAKVPQNAISAPGGAPSVSLASATEAPPRPEGANAIASASPRSLFREANLARVLDAAAAQLGSRANVVAAYLYPGELDLTVFDHGSVERVRIDAHGQVDVVASAPFTGSTDVVYLEQIVASVPAQLAHRIAAGAGIGLGRLDRMETQFDPHHHDARWLVYARGTPVHFRSELTGDHLVEQGPQGTRAL